MSGLLDNVLPWLYSTGNQAKKQVRGLLEDPRAFVSSIGQDLQAQQDERRRALGTLLNPGVFTTPQEQAAAQNALTNEAMNLLGITVWHGSPYKFDKFDSSKIGTGEGAQAYGHGLYLADSPEVAQTYRQTAPYVGRHVQQLGLDALNKSGGDITRARAILHDQYLANKDPYLRQPLADAVNNIAEIAKPSNGNLYKVDLPDDMAAKMLDWDKPLSQQAPEVRKALASWRNEYVAPYEQRGITPMTRMPETGQQLYQALGNNKGAAEFLREHGVAGIRYLDAGSRGRVAPTAGGDWVAETAQGAWIGKFPTREAAEEAMRKQATSNYVVFPGGESQLKILERNGKGLLDR